MGDEWERNEGGRFELEYPDEDVLEAVRDHEPAGTREVADELGLARQSADYRLRHLQDEGPVSKKIVGNSLVWSANE